MEDRPSAEPLRPQLITYPDSLGGDLRELESLLRSELADVFGGGVHLLPPFPSSGDRGFAPMTYDRIDPAFGDWDDVHRLAELGPLTLDVMVNHISRHSPLFVDFEAHGRASDWADVFITTDKVWGDGRPRPGDLDRVALRKPDDPFSVVTIGDGPETEVIWTTFGFSGGPVSEQIDLDIHSPRTLELYDSWFAALAGHGVHTLRLDAVGYLTKEPGTRCFMNEPAIWDHLATLAEIADRHDLAILPEVHDGRPTHLALAERGYLSYDFALPGLVLDALRTGRSARLAEHLRTSPQRQVTMLDCHDGIGVNPDLRGLIGPRDAEALVDWCVQRGANLTPTHHGDVDPSPTHQINVSYPAAAGDDDALLVARALQLFAPGLPQIYYVGLLAGGNDHDAVQRTGELRAINRHDFTRDEVATAMRRPVVRRQLDLIRLRDRHPAFGGVVRAVDTPSASTISVIWQDGDDRARLDADLASRSLRIVATPNVRFEVW